MISQTWIIGKAIRALFADRVTYEFFSSVFTTEPETDLPSLPDKTKGHYLDNVIITHNYY